MSTLTIPSFDTWVPAPLNERLRSRQYKPENEILCDDSLNVAGNGGKTVVVVGDVGSGKSALINEILGVGDLCVTTDWDDEAGSQVKYTYQYREDSNIAASIYFLSRISPAAIRVSHDDETSLVDQTAERELGVDVEDIVCPDVKSFHAAILVYIDSPAYTVKKISVFVKSPVLAGGLTIIELPNEENIKDHEIGDKYLILCPMRWGLHEINDILEYQLEDTISAAKHGELDVSLLITFSEEFAYDDDKRHWMVKHDTTAPFPALKTATEQSETHLTRILTNAVYDEALQPIWDDPATQAATIELERLREYDQMLETHALRACTFRQLDLIRQKWAKLFKNRDTGASITVRLAAAAQYRWLQAARAVETHGPELLSAEETELPALRRWLRNL